MTVGRAACQPAHADGIAAMEPLEFLERNLGLATLTVHECLTADEGWLLNVKGLAVSSVDDDVDRRGVVDEIFGQCFKSELVGVVLDKFSEDVRGLLGIAIR